MVETVFPRGGRYGSICRMEKIATDTYSFEKLRQNGYVYVDKTDILLSLADGSLGTQFFIARPRRFGKSLAVSTLQCLFEGRRDLFKGLAIEPKWDWAKTWPVLRLDMGSCQAATVEAFWGKLGDLLISESDRLQIPLRGKSPSSQFRFLIEDLARRNRADILAAAKARGEEPPTDVKGQMVLLVDEYDKPLLGHLGRPDVNDIRDALKDFYSVIKTCEGLQRFAFITGVSKFSKVSIFSDLNNLNEFSMDARVAELFGYTHEEVLANFPESLKALAQAYGWSDEETFATLVTQYDGYRFHQDGRRMFNPVSIGKCLSAHEIKNYWFETGTPTFLLGLLKASPIDLTDVVLDADSFSVYEPATPAMMPLLYQTGYLTITDSFREGLTTMYHLGFPNGEVRTAFSKAMANEFSELDPVDSTSLLTQMVGALRAGDVNDMLDALSCFFANIPANITVKREKYYQSLFYAVFVLIGARTHAECWTNRGRVDAVVETANDVYVFEFKLNDTAEAALAQIKAKGYHEKYLRAGKRLTLVGAAFDAEMRNLSDRAIEVAAQA